MSNSIQEFTTTASTTAEDRSQTDDAVKALWVEVDRLNRRVAEQDAQIAALAGFTPEAAGPTPTTTGAARSSRRAALAKVAAMATLGWAAWSGGVAHADNGKPNKGAVRPPTRETKTAPRAPTVNELFMGVVNIAPGAGSGAETLFEQNGTAWLDRFVLHVSQNVGETGVNNAIRDSLFFSYPGLREPVSALIGSTTVATTGTAGRRAYGVVGYSLDGVGTAGAGLWPIQVVGQDAPPAVANADGQFAPYGALHYQLNDIGTADSLWLKTYDNAGPVWRRIAHGAQLGVLTPTPQPVRVLDTRAGSLVGFDATGNPIVAGAVPIIAGVGFRVAGKTFGGFAFPADTKGVFGTLFLVDTGPTGGFVTLAGSNPPSASAVTITPNGAAPFIASSSALTGLDSLGNFWLRNVGVARHIGFDVSGYYI